MHIAYKVIGEKSEEISEREKIILELIRSNPGITLAEISEKIGKSLRTVKLTMKSLQDKGVINRLGGRKLGSWKVN